MAGMTTRAVSKEEFENIITTIRTGFVFPSGKRVRPNEPIAMALTLECNLGIRISDVVKLRLTDIIFENGRYHLNITEKKTGKKRTFTVPDQIYIYLQNYVIAQKINPHYRLFPISVRTVQNHLHLTCQYLGIEGVGTHSFRKFFAQEIYKNSNFNIELVRILLQHSSVAVSQRYLGMSSKEVEDALKQHIILPT